MLKDNDGNIICSERIDWTDVILDKAPKIGFPLSSISAFILKCGCEKGVWCPDIFKRHEGNLSLYKIIKAILKKRSFIAIEAMPTTFWCIPVLNNFFFNLQLDISERTSWNHDFDQTWITLDFSTSSTYLEINKTLEELIDSENLSPVIDVISQLSEIVDSNKICRSISHSKGIENHSAEFISSSEENRKVEMFCRFHYGTCYTCYRLQNSKLINRFKTPSIPESPDEFIERARRYEESRLVFGKVPSERLGSP